MSSKSRHEHKARKPRHSVEHVDGGHAELPSVEDFEEVIHVPEGRSRAQFLFLIGLMIFLLIVFIVPSAFNRALTKGSDGETLPAVSFTTAGGEFTMGPLDFQMEKRAEDAFRRVTNPYVRSTPSSAEAATTLLLDRLSEEAGVFVPDDVLVSALTNFATQLGGVESYTQTMRQRFPGGAPGFEEHLRRGMRITRYLELVGRLGAKADVGEIESAWKTQHALHAFDLIEAPATAFTDEALADVPDDATLEAWFAKRPDWERSALETQPAWRLASAMINIGDEPPAALLERYPLAEDFDAAGEGEHFYTLHASTAFKLEEPRVDDEGNEIRFAPQEEVAAELESSARALTALQAWRSDMQTRLDAGEAVDVAAEAAELGVAFVEGKTARERADLIEDTDFGGGLLATKLDSAAAGDVLDDVFVTRKVLELVEVMELREPSLPPFAEIRDAVVDSWVKEHSAELAQAYLEGLKGEAETMDADSFKALAAGDDKLTYSLQDWRDSSSNDTPTDFEPASLFIRFQAQGLGLYELEEGGLSAAVLSTTQDRAFLARSLGSRERDFSEATPAEVESVQTSLQSDALTDFRSAFSSPVEGELPVYLVEHFDLQLPSEVASQKKADEERAQREAAAAKGEEAPTEG